MSSAGSFSFSHIDSRPIGGVPSSVDDGPFGPFQGETAIVVFAGEKTPARRDVVVIGNMNHGEAGIRRKG